MSSNATSVAKWWILTIPCHAFMPYLPPACTYVRGQLELGAGGFRHWQFVCHMRENSRLSRIRSIFGEYHAEPTRSAAARDYVWKDDTAIPNTRFELGTPPFRRNSQVDWDMVKDHAISGRLDLIPSEIFVRYYASLRTIRGDFAYAVAAERTCTVLWGPTGVGKSKYAWEQAGQDAYPKDPRTKFWCGYRGEEYVVIDEFRGGIDISHLLRWLDRYPVRVEIKGASVPLCARVFYITSNIVPSSWYPDCDGATCDALERRLNIIHLT